MPVVMVMVGPSFNLLLAIHLDHSVFSEGHWFQMVKGGMGQECSSAPAALDSGFMA
jgi:hypothetical protein